MYAATYRLCCGKQKLIYVAVGEEQCESGGILIQYLKDYLGAQVLACIGEQNAEKANFYCDLV